MQSWQTVGLLEMTCLLQRGTHDWYLYGPVSQLGSFSRHQSGGRCPIIMAVEAASGVFDGRVWHGTREVGYVHESLTPLGWMIPQTENLLLVPERCRRVKEAKMACAIAPHAFWKCLDSWQPRFRCSYHSKSSRSFPRACAPFGYHVRFCSPDSASVWL